MSSSADSTLWQRNRHCIKTNIGKWLAGDDVIVRGRSLLNEWVDELNFVQLNVLNITGRVIDEPLSRWLEKSLFFTSYPDARIWCNQMGALAGTQKTSPASAFVLGCLAADSKAYGSKAQYLAVLVLQDMQSARESGQTVPEIIEAFPKSQGFPMISGFSRPVRVNDERLQPARRLSKELGFEPGVHLQLAEEVSDYLLRTYGLGMNAAGFCSGFLLDQNFSPIEVYRLRVADVASGTMACYCDNIEQPENSFLPLQCRDINYRGPAKRSLKLHRK